MLKQKTIFLILCLLVLGNDHLLAQLKKADSAELLRKTIYAARITEDCRVDGYLNEPFWNTLPVATDFVQYSPRNGNYPSYKTEVRYGYDDDALYIGAIMFDPHTDSLCNEMGKRDQIEVLVVDYISFDILPYNDGLNMYEFKVTPAGLQHDCKYSAVGQDIAWDAVWQSATRVGDSAWYAEIRLPYSALRFPKIEKQVWGINMWRSIRRNNEWSTWSFVDNKVQDIFKFYGELKGIENIDPPLRLSITPYMASYVEKSPGEKIWSKSLKGGVDLRWGLNESYTLDMMLIPDFGQVQADDKVLNLSPFEIRYDEKRQYFTEGTEMFDKCGIFYSRRVGGIPRNYYNPYNALGNNELVRHNPEETRILNATKISGRNSKGLGLGFFNAITSPAYALIANDSSGSERKEMTQPFTNYNVAVLDQNLKNNSYFSLINTNIYIPADEYYANVTGAEGKFSTSSKKFEAFGRVNLSNTQGEMNNRIFGHQMNLSVFKPSGRFQYELSREHADSRYNPNDMGYIEVNNYSENILNTWYNFFEPKGFYMNQIYRFTAVYRTLYEKSKLINAGFEVSNKITYKNFWSSHVTFSVAPWGDNDYHEPRVWGWYFHKPLAVSGAVQINTDSRKAFYFVANDEITSFPEISLTSNTINFLPRYRFTDRFSLFYQLSFTTMKNDYGWVNTVGTEYADPDIFFGKRNVKTVNSILSGKYILNTKLLATFRLRHYWSEVEYIDFYRLLKNGQLENSLYTGSHDINFNAFTGDLQLVWYFAPGSELSIVWKDAITTLDETVWENYFRNLGNTIDQPMAKSFSLRVLYYIDYSTVRKKIHKQ